MAKRPPAAPDREIAREILSSLWADVLADDQATAPAEIVQLVNSDQIAVRFCLPTQLLGKVSDPSLDALALQRGDGAEGKWDPRGFASAVIVPWNVANQRVLGQSGDPYVSNPLRRPRADSGLDQMADKAQWSALCSVLIGVQEADSQEYTRERLRETLVAIRDRLRTLTFTYLLPQRVSLSQASKLVTDFLAETSGGDRGLAVAAALFETFRDRFQIYSAIRRGVINATDTSTGAAADLECLANDNKSIVLAVEVKERFINDADVEAAVAKARALAVRELLLCTNGVMQNQREAVTSRIGSAWASGTSVYLTTIQELIFNALPLVGESGIREFVSKVGAQLDTFSTQPRHRQAWKKLLDAL